jgi:hypothetical protein
MQNLMPRLSISLFALLVVAGNAARAGMIDFSWSATITPSVLTADKGTADSLGFVGAGGAAKYFGRPGYNYNEVHAVAATYSPTTFNEALSTYTNKSFTLALKLTDGSSGLSDVLTFHGYLNGIPYGMPTVSFYDGVSPITIGHDSYQVQMLNGGLVGVNPDPYPDIFAKIDASSASNTPEPSSLLLAAAALPWLGLSSLALQARKTGKPRRASYKNRNQLCGGSS